MNLMPTPPTSSVAAEQVYAWLQGLDPNDEPAKRAELLATGVPGHTVFALYPVDFAAIVPELQSHFEATSITSTLRQLLALQDQQFALSKLLEEMDGGNEGAMQRLSGIWLEQDAIDALTQTLYQELEGAAAKNAKGIATSCTLVLWNVYGLIHRRHLMTGRQLAQLDSIASWLGSNLLKLR